MSFTEALDAEIARAEAEIRESLRRDFDRRAFGWYWGCPCCRYELMTIVGRYGYYCRCCDYWWKPEELEHARQPA